MVFLNILGICSFSLHSCYSFFGVSSHFAIRLEKISTKSYLLQNAVLGFVYFIIDADKELNTISDSFQIRQAT